MGRRRASELEWIAPDLRGLARPVGELVPDPSNYRRHSPENLAAIRASLEAHGQRKPVVGKDGVVYAGNGTLEVARAFGWTHLAYVEYEGSVERCRAYGIADNRSGELATWDPAALGAGLRELEAAGLLAATGYDGAGLAEALEAADRAISEAATASGEVRDGAEDDDLEPSDVDVVQPPFPWFGGKRKVAGEVWAALGDVDSYVEPFAGSLAVLLHRPSWHEGRLATVNDLDAYVANFWRASRAAPDEVAEHADHPVNETDLEARQLWLVNEGRAIVERLRSDPEFYDAKVAGWWCWGLCCWIGSGWCSGTGPHRQLPHLGSEGQGVNRQLPHLGSEGQGVNRKLPHLLNEGRGVNRQRPHLGDGPPERGPGSEPEAPSPRGREEERRAHAVAYARSLRDALRDVRVCCGDWTRVLTDGALAYGDSIGVFLDPPYADEVRTKGLYAQDDGGNHLSADVREWALSHGDDPRYRIVLAGYETEHEAHVPASWRRVRWSASRAYGTASGEDRLNRRLERLWLSPHCLRRGP